MRKQVLKNKVLEILGIGGVFKTYYDTQKIIFIHTPKTAGTSISKALYGSSPWHFSLDELNFINHNKVQYYFKFGFVRNPISRLISTYNYSKYWIKKNPKTSISFMKNIGSFDEFVTNYLTEKLISKHYFFWPYSEYLLSSKNKISVDFVGKFENLSTDIENLSRDYGLEIQVEHLNKSANSNESLVISESVLNRIYKIYKKDFDQFDYECNYTRPD